MHPSLSDKKQKFIELLEWNVELEGSVSHDELTAKILTNFADFLEQHYARLFWLLRTFRVKGVTEQQVKIVSAFLAYYTVGIKTCTEAMIRFLVKEVMEDSQTRLMSQLHRLGDFKVISIIRTPKLTRELGGRYRFLLTDTFLEHIGNFWEGEK